MLLTPLLKRFTRGEDVGVEVGVFDGVDVRDAVDVCVDVREDECVVGGVAVVDAVVLPLALWELDGVFDGVPD